MFHRFKPFLLVLFLSLVVTPPSTQAAKPANTWVPEKAVVVAEISNPRAFLDRVFSDDIMSLVKSNPLYQQQIDSPQAKQAKNLIEYFEKRYETDWQTLLKKLVGGGVTWALGPGENSLLIVESEDAKLLEEVHEFFLVIARNEGDPKEFDYGGVKAYAFGPNEAHAIIENRLVLANRPEVLERVAKLHGSSSATGIAQTKRFQDAKRGLGDKPAATIFADMSVLKQVPNVKKGLENGLNNPVGLLLFAPILESLQESSWLGVGLSVEGNRVMLNAATDGTANAPSAPTGFASPGNPDGGALPNLDLDGRIAGLSFFRDLYKFYRAKDELFPERTSGLIFFENMMGIFFTGRDLTEEVLAETYPDVRIVVATQQYEDGTPASQIPGFAIVLRMRNPEKFAPIVEEAWQKALGLVNFTRGQQAQAGLIIDRPVHNGVKYTKAYFSAAGEEEKESLDFRFNFQPSLAMPGEYLILSSSDSVTQRLIDALSNEAGDLPKPVAGMNTLAEIDGKATHTILDANRDALIRNNMVEEGNTQEEAEAAIGVLLEIIDHIERIALTAGAIDGQTEIGLTVDFDLP